MRISLLLPVTALWLCAGAGFVRAEGDKRRDAASTVSEGGSGVPPLIPGQFPLKGTASQTGGDLIEADFIHRAGAFRKDGSGEIVSFTMPPFAFLRYLNTEADLRDVPLGTHLRWFLYPDAEGALTKLITAEDDFTQKASTGAAWRLEEIPSGGKVLKLLNPSPGADPARLDLAFDEQTRFWKGDHSVSLESLKPGDLMLVNTTGNPPRCREAWVGEESQKRATEAQRKNHLAFLRDRGLPALVDRVEGKKVAVSFLGDPASFEALLKDEGIDPDQWAREHRRVSAAVANEELRTYNPPVDQKASTVLESRRVPTDHYGGTGLSWVIQPDLLLEGFRKGHIIRIFKEGWPLKDMPYGESVYGEVFNAEAVETDPDHYPFRTDFANPQLPWYQLRAGEFPPLYSAHQVGGELLSVDAADRTGQFRTDRTGELVNFALLPYAFPQYVNAEADLADVPPGTRCLFSLHQDARGVWNQVSLLRDEFSSQAAERLTFRLDAVLAEEGKLLVAKRIPEMKDERDVMIQPPDLGRMEIQVDGHTRVWRAAKAIPLSELRAGDSLRFNRGARTKTSQGLCTDIWAEPETHQLATETQRNKHYGQLAESGHPAWIDSVDDRKITVTFFAASPAEFNLVMKDDPKGKVVSVQLADEKWKPADEVQEGVKVLTRLPESKVAGVYGSSRVRWELELKQLPENCRKGRLVRVMVK